MNWKWVGWLSALLVAMAVIGGMRSVLADRASANASVKEPEASRWLPLATGFAATTASRVDPKLHCVALPAGIRLHPQFTTRDWMDRQFLGASDWTVIRERMKPGDDIYAYDNIVHPPPGIGGFIGNGGGYVVLRGWCLIGRFGTWAE
jgi:hypothetical protein